MSNRNAFGLALQEEVGTPVETMAFWPPIVSASFSPDPKVLEIEETLGVFGSPDIKLGTAAFPGTVEGACRPGSLPALLAMPFGHPDTTSPATDCYKHLHNPTATGKVPTPASIMAINNDIDPALVDLYSDVFATSMELSCQADDYLMFSMAALALNLDTTQAAPTITRDGTTKFAFDDITATYYVNGGSVQTIDIAGFTLRYGRGTETKKARLGTKRYPGVKHGNIDCTVEFEALENLTEHNRRVIADNADAVRLVILAQGADVVTGHPYEFGFDLAKLRYTEAAIPLAANETTESVPVSARSVFDDAAGKQIELWTVNGDAGASY